MQKDNIASAHATQPLGYPLGGLWFPVSRPPRPHYHPAITPLSYDPAKHRASEAKWGTHPPRPFARRRLDCIVAAIQLLCDSCRRVKCYAARRSV